MFIDGIYLFNLLDLRHIETETEIFQMYSYNGERPWPSLYTKYTTVLSDNIALVSFAFVSLQMLKKQRTI